MHPVKIKATAEEAAALANGFDYMLLEYTAVKKPTFQQILVAQVVQEMLYKLKRKLINPPSKLTLTFSVAEGAAILIMYTCVNIHGMPSFDKNIVLSTTTTLHKQLI